MSRYILSLAFVATSTGFLVLGCGTDTTGQTTTGTPQQGISLENANAEFAKYFCDLIFSCCNSAELGNILSTLDPMPKTAAECEAPMTTIADSEIFAVVKDGVSKGRLTYDEAQAGVCFAKIRGQCSTYKAGFFEADPACKTVVTGKVADGGDCLQDHECMSASSFCNLNVDPNVGKCTPYGKENESCDNGRCVAGLVCSADVSPLCIKPKADGAMCNSDFECASQYCDFSTMNCTPKKANGEGCDSTYACKDGFCDIGTSVCTAKKPIGEACMDYEECVSNECDFNTNQCSGPRCDGM